MLRKALFDRSDEIKEMGMNGVLLLLKVFKLKSALPVTQLSQSSGGLLSQVSLIKHQQKIFLHFKVDFAPRPFHPFIEAHHLPMSLYVAN